MGKRGKASHAADVAVLKTVAKGITAERARAVHKVARSLDKDTLDEVCDANTIKSSARRFFKEIAVVESLALNDGSMWDLECADPSKLMRLVMAHNESLFDVFRKAWHAKAPNPVQPWSLIYGCDEAWSGNPLHESGRKAMILSFSFKQFGRRFVTQSACWFTPVIVRSRQFKQIPGQWSQILAIVLRKHLLELVAGLMLGGAVLAIGGENFLLCNLGSVDMRRRWLEAMHRVQGGIGHSLLPSVQERG